MYGHGTIGVVRTSSTSYRAGPVSLDTPVGTVRADLSADGSVTIENVPSFLHARDVTSCGGREPRDRRRRLQATGSHPRVERRPKRRRSAARVTRSPGASQRRRDRRRRRESIT
jgi:hypothetical protein